MALDNLTLKIISDKLNNELIGAYLDKPFALSDKDFAINYHSANNSINKGRGCLIISLNGENPYLTVSYDKFTKVNTINTPFFNSLKKLTGTQITSIEKIPGDRIIKLESKVTNDNLETINTSYTVIFELFPNLPNCYIIPSPYNKVVSLFKEHTDIMSNRYIARNLPYIYPVKREGLTKSCTDLMEAKKYLSFSLYKYFAKYNENHSFEDSLNSLLNSTDLYFINNTLLPFHFDLNEASRINYYDIYSLYIKNQNQVAKSLNNLELIKLVNKNLDLANKKLLHIKNDLKNAKNKLIYKDYGQEIFLHQLEIPNKATSCDFDNYHILLDSKLTAIENANRYFKLYHKAKIAIQTLTPLISKVEEEISYLKIKLLQIEKGNSQDILELKQELLEEGYIKENNNLIKSKKSSKKVSPHYLKTDFCLIGFGMNAYQNEELTFNIAKKDDLFFHIKDYPSNHVVLLEGFEEKSILLAAELCLYLSNKKEGEILYTKRKYVKKNKEKRGLVNLLEYKSITIHSINKEDESLFEENLKIKSK